MSDYYALRRQLAEARLRGFEGTNTSVFVSHMPYCDKPVPIKNRSKGGQNMITGKRLPSLEVQRFGPCRKCEKCLKFRKLHWRERAITEVIAAPRTWALTLTLTDRMIAIALTEMKGRGSNNIEPYLYARTAQLYWKRLRKAGHKFRYFGVHELGERTGRSHYHVLLSERDHDQIPKRAIERAWPAHVHARLVGATPEDRQRAVGYVTTYTTKDFTCRPRASQRYGKGVAT